MSKDIEYIDMMGEKVGQRVSIKRELENDRHQSQIRLEQLCGRMLEGGMSYKEVSQKMGMRDAFIRAKRGY